MAQKSGIIKARSMDKNEVTLLLDCIVKHKILTSKVTNATNNKLKKEAWNAISKEFSSYLGETRLPDQLRLKWENLKKAARKRSAAIKEAGGKTFIAPDDVLDRVISMLGASDGLTADYGGDSKQNISTEMDEDRTEYGDSDGLLITGNYSATEELHSDYTPKKNVYISKNKRRKLIEDLHRAQIEKELSLAAYFRAKSQKIELENVKLRMEIDKLQNN